MVFQEAFPELGDSIKPSTRAQKLFPYVFEVLHGKLFVGFEEAKTCRLVCSTWKEGVDEYYQSKNFNSVENIHGEKNQSDLILKMPLRRIDIDRIYEMDLNAGCVSFGKKLTLEMVYDERGKPLFPHHLGQVNALLRNVPRFWEQFDHLEVRPSEHRVPVNRNSDERRTTGRTNPDFVAVPFGDMYSDEEIGELVEWARKVREKKQYSLLTTNFDMFIPFLHLMTNLKKVSLRLDHDIIMQIHILLRIPRTENLKEIVASDDVAGWALDRANGSTEEVSVTLYERCAKSICFLAGATICLLENCTPRIEKFENLTELHVTIVPMYDERASLAGLSANMFPNVTILKIERRQSLLCWWFPMTDPDDWLVKFVEKFPALKYLSFSGGCMEKCVECANLKTIYRCKAGDDNTQRGPVAISSSSSTGGSGLKTFRFECPLHVPVGLMRMFPAMQHVIVDEYPDRCRRQNSKSTDGKYLGGFFAMFPNVLSLTFVPFTRCEETGEWLCGPGNVTRYRDEKKRGKKRKMK